MSQGGAFYSDNNDIEPLRNDMSKDLNLLSDNVGKDATKALDYLVILE